MKEVEQLLKDLEVDDGNNLLKTFLETKTVDEIKIGKHVDFFNSTTNKYKSITVMPEYNKKSKTGFLFGIPAPEIIGGILRDAGAKAIAVDMDKRSGGVTVDEFSRFVKEQYRARRMSPSPIAILWADFIIDKIQIAQAACHGAAAITLNPEFSDDLDGLVAYAKELNIEPVILVKSEKEIEIALQTSTRSICIHSVEEKDIIRFREMMPTNDNMQYIARLRPFGEFSTYAEIDSSWTLRDAGLHCVWPSPEAVFAEGLYDVYSSVSAMRAKASRKYLSPRQFMMDRKKEGAQEYLGDILY